MEVDVPEEDQITLAQAKSMIAQVRNNCGRLGIPNSAVVHLDRFTKGVRKLKLEKPKKDQFIHNFFKKVPKKKSG